VESWLTKRAMSGMITQTTAYLVPFKELKWSVLTVLADLGNGVDLRFLPFFCRVAGYVSRLGEDFIPRMAERRHNS
jgi:hypothetical protein